MKVPKTGEGVLWRWAGGAAEGIVKEVRSVRTEITSKGKTIVRNGTNENPALIIEHTSGTPILKLLSEIESTAHESD